MKTFRQFQENAYKPPKTVNKVAKEYEKSGAKFPDSEAFKGIKKFTGEITDNETQADFKSFLKNRLRGFTRRGTPVVGNDTQYVNPNTNRKTRNLIKQNFKQKNKFDINQPYNIKVKTHPMIAPLHDPNAPKVSSLT